MVAWNRNPLNVMLLARRQREMCLSYTDFCNMLSQLSGVGAADGKISSWWKTVSFEGSVYGLFEEYSRNLVEGAEICEF